MALRQQGRPGQNSISVAPIFANFLVDAPIRPACSGAAPRPATLPTESSNQDALGSGLCLPGQEAPGPGPWGSRFESDRGRVTWINLRQKIVVKTSKNNHAVEMRQDATGGNNVTLGFACLFRWKQLPAQTAIMISEVMKFICSD